MENLNQKIYRVVAYFRLSDDDGAYCESDSISNQRILIHNYLQDKPEFKIVEECVDDGYTGTNFDRPGFQKVIHLLETGAADCLIAKDLSRFGRDFSGVLQYIERIFPKMGVRVIFINDNYDSLNKNQDYFSLRLKSFINDVYPADTSRSVRANLKAKMTDGQCVAPFAFFGFLKSPEDKHKLIADPVAGPVVKDIFQMKLKGYSLLDIAGILNKRGILPPLAYKRVFLKQKQQTGFATKKVSVWEPTMVRRILLDERYTGVLIQGKRTTPNHKVKKVIHKSEEEWIRCEDAMEPLIDKHTYEVVKNLMGRDTRKSIQGLALLGGLVEYADCNHNMIRKSPDGRNYYYICSTFLYEKECTAHSFSEKQLIQVVKKCLLHYISTMVELDRVLGHMKTLSIPEQKVYEADRYLTLIEEECNRIMRIKQNLYGSFCEGLIDEEEFQTYKKQYDVDLKKYEESAKKQREEVKRTLAEFERQQDWIKEVLTYQKAEEVDRLMVVMLIKRIYIHEGKKVTVEFWFQDEFERMLFLIETVNKIKPDRILKTFLKGRGKQDAQGK